MTGRALLVAVALLAGAACGGASYLDVTVHAGAPAVAFTSLRVSVTSGTSHASDIVITPSAADAALAPDQSFVLVFGDGRAGDVNVAVSALDGNGAPIASGSQTATLVAHGTAHVTIPLGAPAIDGGSDAGDGAFPVETDCLDGLDDNGDGLTDCEDPTCLDRVACVDDVPIGDDVGRLSVACSDVAFGPATAYTQVTSMGGCSCACQTMITCSLDIAFDAVDFQCFVTNQSAPVTLTVRAPSGGQAATPACLDFGGLWPASLTSVAVSAPTRSAATVAVPVGSATLQPFVTMTSDFCPARSWSRTCGPARRCAPLDPGGDHLCVRVPSAGAGCPAGYPTPRGDWYTTIADHRSCGACSTTVTVDGDCSALAIQSRLQLSAQACATDIPDPSSTNYLSGVGGCDSQNIKAQWDRVNASVYSSDLGAENGQCTASTTLVGQVDGAGGSTVCCR